MNDNDKDKSRWVGIWEAYYIMSYQGIDRGSFQEYISRSGDVNRQMLLWLIKQKKLEEDHNERLNKQK